MIVNPPRHVVPLPPAKTRRTKVHLDLVRALEANRGVHVVVDARHVDADKRVRQAASIVGEEQRAGAELVSATDDVPRRYSRKRRRRVVSTAVGVLEELAQIVEV